MYPYILLSLLKGLKTKKAVSLSCFENIVSVISNWFSKYCFFSAATSEVPGDWLPRYKALLTISWQAAVSHVWVAETASQGQ